MSFEIFVMPRAEADLRKSTRWWAENRSLEQATRWWDGIFAAIQTLRTESGRCPLARENRKHPYEIRELHFGLAARPTHRVLFTLRDNTVVILTVRHVAQDDWDG